MPVVPAAIAGDLAPTGTLRASINLGNPVLAQGTPEAPRGVTVEIARDLGARLGIPVELVCFDAARKSLQAMLAGRTDICFLAIEPAREADVAFTAPYLVIEGVFAVPRASPISTTADVDRDGVRIGVKQGSAYDLFLSRTLEHATVVRGDEGIDVFRSLGLEVAAGIRQPLQELVDRDPGLRLLDDRFMEIRQAVGTTTTRRPETIALPAGVRGGAEGRRVHRRRAAAAGPGPADRALARVGRGRTQGARMPSQITVTRCWREIVSPEPLGRVVRGRDAARAALRRSCRRGPRPPPARVPADGRRPPRSRARCLRRSARPRTRRRARP